MLLLLALYSRLAEAVPAFGYDSHGADWSTGSCKSRTQQSPVSFSNVYGPPLGSFEVNYNAPLVDYTLVNDGVGLTARLAASEKNKRGVVLRGEAYTLDAISFHSPAEHTFGAHRPALEVQLRHMAKGSPRSVIVSILFAQDQLPPVATPGYAPPSPKDVGYSTMLSA